MEGCLEYCNAHLLPFPMQIDTLLLTSTTNRRITCHVAKVGIAQSLKCTTELTQSQLNRNRITTASLFSVFYHVAILTVIVRTFLTSCQPMYMSCALLFTVILRS